MKRYTLLFAVLGILLISSLAMAGMTPKTGIVGSYHDLSTLGAATNWGDTAEQNEANGGLNRICIYCHAPHHTLSPAEAELKGYDYLPLWNHKLSEVTYIYYSNISNNPNDTDHQFNGAASIGQPGGVSRLCLSCHDGSVATNAYGFAPSLSLGAGDKKFATTHRANLGGTDSDDLSNDHPIGFLYANADDNDAEIAAATATMNAQYSIGDLLWGGRMECTTCHDVHNTQNDGEKFLWVSDKNSGLCLTCHLKGTLTP
ncbi:MAG: hypothetical protein A2X56_05285 [Nitrospirae bacterium GWC2_57_13]|jgi:predicted CXXCH cytochrome family protein|nr:MAG: hypothetical protein A2072_01725 [Nitrospirae bacterium GWC1_57_7]OGW27315.1 MAG: hypothetical protein A2X56_05285 [Nitrospirae bacterium GWC2_57_13]HAR46277.1 hypothetical protein [Nitrospiraceae bacterium]